MADNRIIIWNLAPALTQAADSDPSVPKRLATLSAHLAGRAAAAAATVAPGAPPPPDDAYPEVHLAIPKLCLLLAVMTALDVPRVHYHETNGNCLGVALHEPLWPPPDAPDSECQLRETNF